LDKELHTLLLQLQQDKSLKVWSLIITFFGDVVVARGGNVSAKTVQKVLAAMGIGSGAVRTALSRLAGDNWIERHKVGRESYYELAKDGYQTFQQASVRIYAPVPVAKSVRKHNGTWQIAITGPASGEGSGMADTPDNGIQVAPNCRLYFEPNQEAANNNSLIVNGELQQVPCWVTERIMPASTRLSYQTLVNRFAIIKSVDQLSPLDCLVLRCLIIHEWRRILLKTPVVPEELHTEDWPEKICRQFVSLWYQQLVVKSESWLDEYATCVHGALPKPCLTSTDSVKSRFTPDFQVT